MSSATSSFKRAVTAHGQALSLLCMLRERRLSSVAIALAVAGSVTACGSPCGSGADSATEAVAGLLEAASTGDDSLCRFVPEGGEGVARQAIDGLEPHIRAAGGLSKLSVVEQTARQMGGEHVVAVSAGATQFREFVVIESAGSFVVLVDAKATNPG